MNETLPLNMTLVPGMLVPYSQDRRRDGGPSSIVMSLWRELTLTGAEVSSGITRTSGS